MSHALPRRPNLEHLKKSAKQLLAAHRQGDARCCPFLRRLNRFAQASDEQILAAHLTLHDVQHLVAIVHGFSSWQELRRNVLAARSLNEISLDAVRERSVEPIPPYAGVGVVLGTVAALNHAGVEIEFMEFAAASGWAFSFGYRYDDISPAYVAVRGRPDRDGPFEVFAHLPRLLGCDYEQVSTQDHEALWRFVCRHVDAGTPILSEHLDGGLVTGYQEHGGRRRLHFDGPVGGGWTDLTEFQPHALYVLIRRRTAESRDGIIRASLQRAVGKGAPHTWSGTPQGLTALEAYAADVADPAKDFAKTQEWFCWAAFSRLMARRCCDVWLTAVAPVLDGRAATLAREAAAQYGRAFQSYDRFRREVSAGEPTTLSFHQRARAPERLGHIAATLREGVRAEEAGLAVLELAAKEAGA